MGVVYRAFDERLERRVAVKHIRRRDAADRRSRERLRLEARTVASLSHPAIVQIHDILEENNADWIVMELVEGQTLHTILQDGPLPLAQTLYLALEVADGLAEAHNKGIVHRDLKTENVMVTPSGHAKILDFGLAKRLWTEEAGKDISLSVQGTILGTGRAMSPEQVLGDPVDHRSDIFSFGTMLYEMASGERPFMGSSLVLTMAQVCSEEHRSLGLLEPKLPEGLVALVDRLLKKRPEQRPQSAREVVASLSRIGGIPLPERSTLATVQRMVPSPGTGSSSPDPTPTEVAPLPKALLAPQNSGESTTGIFLKTLVHLELEGTETADLEAGGPGEGAFFDRYESQLLDLVRSLHGQDIDRNGGHLLLFERPIDAVQFALEHRDTLSKLSREMGASVSVRTGVHLGEVLVRESSLAELQSGSGPLELEGPARRVAASLADLAHPGQILLTREAAQLSRHTLDGRLSGAALRWSVHGRFRFEGVDDPVAVQEVGSLSQRPVRTGVPGVHALDSEALGGGVDSGRRGLLSIGLMVGVLLVIGLWQMSDLGSQGTVAARSAIAVLQFENKGAPEEAWLGTALSELFSAELEASEELRLITGNSVARLQVEMGSGNDSLGRDMLHRIRRVLGADYVLQGSFVTLGTSDTGKVTVVLRLHDTHRREQVAVFRKDGTKANLFGLVENMGDDLRERMGFKVLTQTEAEVTRVALPSNSTAIRAYSEGIEAMRAFDARRARTAFEQVVAIEPNNALGYAGLSEAWRALGYDSRARETSARAYQLAEGLPRLHALWIEGHYHEAWEDWPKAITAYEELWRLYPDDVENGLLLAAAQIAGNRAAEALNTVSTLRRLPSPSGQDPRLDLAEATAQESLGNYEIMLKRARSALSQVAVEDSPFFVAEARRVEGFAHYYLQQLELAGASLEESQRLFERAGDRGKVADILFAKAFLRSIEGELGTAEEHLRKALEIHRETGSSKGVSKAQNGLAYMLQAKGDLEEAQDLLQSALITARQVGDRQREATYLDSLTWVAIKRGDMPRARALAQDLQTIAEEVGDRLELSYGLFYAGAVAAEGGDLEQARDLYESSLELSRSMRRASLSGFSLRGLLELALASGKLEEAVAFDTQAQELEESFDRSWEVAANELLRARLWRAQGRLPEALELAEVVAQKFHDLERRDEEVLALAEVASVALELGDRSAARAALEAIQTARPSGSQNPRVSMAKALVMERLGDNSSQALGSALASARRLGLLGWELRLDLALLDSSPGGDDPERLRDLLEEATRRGYFAFADRVQRRLAESSEAPLAS